MVLLQNGIGRRRIKIQFPQKSEPRLLYRKSTLQITKTDQARLYASKVLGGHDDYSNPDSVGNNSLAEGAVEPVLK